MRPFLCRWNELPDKMRIPEVRRYWEQLDERYAQIVVKRLIDAMGSAVLLIVLSPAMAATALAIKLDSPGPVMFRQERVTQYGRHFRIHKFRTMVDGADKMGASVTSDGDVRVTKTGVFLRKFRLDEFPQLIDILKGDMTFVGTRPEVPKFVESYTPEMMATLLLPAGVTSGASIEFKNEAEYIGKEEDSDKAYLDFLLPKKMIRNLHDLMNFNIASDFGVVLKTVESVFLS